MCCPRLTPYTEEPIARLLIWLIEIDSAYVFKCYEIKLGDTSHEDSSLNCTAVKRFI